MVPVSRKSERIKINIRVSMSDEIARCLGLGRQVEHTFLFQRVPTNDRGWVEFNNGANLKKK
jgi:hypothetical protein